MSCRKLSEARLWNYLDNETTTTERREVEAHLANCPDCARRLDDLTRHPLNRLALAPAKPPPGFTTRVLVRLAAERAAPRRPTPATWGPLSFPSPRLAGVTAAALALWGICLALAGAYLAPAATALIPSSSAGPNGIALSLRQALGGVLPLFHDWGWAVLLVGMLVAVVLPVVLALGLRFRTH